MVNTTRASLMAQIAELKHFGIITSDDEQIMIMNVERWAKDNPKGVGDGINGTAQ